MTVKVALKDVLEALEIPEEWHAFVDRESGKVLIVSEEAWSIADRPCEGAGDEDEDKAPDWEAQEVEIARRAIEDPGRFAQLPDKFDIHEWDIMRRFSESRRDPRHREALADAIHGHGAFRSFRREIDRLKLKDDWFSYREHALEEIAREWLEAEGFECE